MVNNVSPAVKAAERSMTGDSAAIVSSLPDPASSSSKAKFELVEGSASNASGSVLKVPVTVQLILGQLAF